MVQVRNVEQIMDRILSKIAIEIYNESQINIIKQRAIDTGYLRQSGFYDISEFLHKKVGYSAEYAPYVEWGSPAHFPPIEPIREWAKRKLKVKGKEAEKVAWAIAMKIAKEGTPPKPFLRPAVEKIKRKYKKVVVG